MSKQESISEWMSLAKAFDTAEKDTIKPYVKVILEDTVTKEKLHQYDIPREMFWRYEWVIHWRMAKLQCRRPRHHIAQYLSFYDKQTGLEYGFGSLLSKLTSAKAQVTLINNKIKDYKCKMALDLFFNETTDPVIANLKCKKNNYLDKIKTLEEDIKYKLSTNTQNLNK